MLYVDVEKKILSMIEQNYGKSIMDVNDNLLNRNNNITPVELAALLFDLEEFFLVEIHNEDIINGSFDSISNISKLITEEIQGKSNYAFAGKDI